nr:GH09541p [Drosophila melanogaster]
MRQQQQQQQQQSMDQIDRAGTLPRYGYSSLQQQAENQGRRMGSTFLQKSHQFVDDVSREIRSSASNGIRPGFKRAPSEGSSQQPQAFRDESRVSQYVPELPNTEPVNAHLSRDELAQRQPLFITPLKDIAVGVGGTARFECIVQAHPQPQVNWTHNGGLLESGSRHCIEYRNGVCRLTLPQAYPDDNGSYACTAINPLGAATTSGNLTVSSTNRGFRY